MSAQCQTFHDALHEVEELCVALKTRWEVSYFEF